MQDDTAADNVIGYEYDEADQLVAAVMRAKANNTVVREFGYFYDAAGNRTGEQKDGVDENLQITTGAFNVVNQYSSIQAGGSMRVSGKLDKAGTVTVGKAGQTAKSAYINSDYSFSGVVHGLTAGADNTITVTSRHPGNGNTQSSSYTVSVNNYTPRNFTYDNDGNLLSDGLRSYTWNDLGQLMTITYAGGARVAEFTYNGLGQRIRIVEKNNGTPEKDERLTWLGIELCAVTDAASQNPEPTKTFFPQGRQEGPTGTKYYYTRDHLGSIREVIDGTGAIKVRYDYDPYGRITINNLNGFAGFRHQMAYTGHYYHAPSGLYLTHYRAYDPDTGRWLSRDPIEEQGGLNLYGYVLNCPISRIDTDGRLVWLLPLIVGGAVFGAAMTPYNANAPGPNDPSYPPTSPEEFASSAFGGALGNVLGGTLSKMAGRCCPKPSGWNRAALNTDLEEKGFVHHSTTKGGYVRYIHSDGSEVWIRPNGEVIRLGPKIPGTKYKPRLNARPGTHNSDEFVEPLCDK